MQDFELTILNFIKNTLGHIAKACFFYLRQIVWCEIEDEGVVKEFKNSDDRSFKVAARKLCAIIFVPVNDIVATFFEVYYNLNQPFLNFDTEIVLYFVGKLTRGTRGHGRRRHTFS